MTSLNGVIQAWVEREEAKEATSLLELIGDVSTAEYVRALREHGKDEDLWVSAAAGVLDELETGGAMDHIEEFRRELLEEASRLGIPLSRIEEYRRNSLLLGRIGDLKDYAAAAAFLQLVPGVKEIKWRAYERALEEGKRITTERRKEKDGDPFDEGVVRRMIPVLLRCEYCEYVEGSKEYVERFFIALHDSFARKVVQDVKEHLRKLFPSFGDLVADMQTKITMEDISAFLFAKEGYCLIAIARTAVWWSDGRKRKYALLLERRVLEEEIEVLDVASSGDGPDELSCYIGKVFRYKVYEAEDRLYPELRHLRDNCYQLYRFFLKVLRANSWEAPDRWPPVPYPRNWK